MKNVLSTVIAALIASLVVFSYSAYSKIEANTEFRLNSTEKLDKILISLSRIEGRLGVKE